MSPLSGCNVGVIDQHYKTITRLFLSENALVEDSGKNPHRAIKIDPNSNLSSAAPSTHLPPAS